MAIASVGSSPSSLRIGQLWEHGVAQRPRRRTPHRGVTRAIVMGHEYSTSSRRAPLLFPHRGLRTASDPARLDLSPSAGVADADEMVAVLADPALHEFTGGQPATLDELRDRYRSWAVDLVRTASCGSTGSFTGGPGRSRHGRGRRGAGHDPSSRYRGRGDGGVDVGTAWQRQAMRQSSDLWCNGSRLRARTVTAHVPLMLPRRESPRRVCVKPTTSSTARSNGRLDSVMIDVDPVRVSAVHSDAAALRHRALQRLDHVVDPRLGHTTARVLVILIGRSAAAEVALVGDETDEVPADSDLAAETHVDRRGARASPPGGPGGSLTAVAGSTLAIRSIGVSRARPCAREVGDSASSTVAPLASWASFTAAECNRADL